MPRGSGKTTAAEKLLDSTTDKVLYVSAMPTRFRTSNQKIHITTAAAVLNNGLIGNRFDLVILDDYLHYPNLLEFNRHILMACGVNADIVIFSGGNKQYKREFLEYTRANKRYGYTFPNWIKLSKEAQLQIDELHNNFITDADELIIVDGKEDLDKKQLMPKIRYELEILNKVFI